MNYVVATSLINLVLTKDIVTYHTKTLNQLVKNMSLEINTRKEPLKTLFMLNTTKYITAFIQ